MYLAFFGRAPDVKGLEYWQERLLEGGESFAAIAREFAWSPEAQWLFPKDASNREFVRSIYQNCFGREPDKGGWDYWTQRLDAMGTTNLNDRGALVGELVLGAYAPTSGAEDRTLLSNRHEVAMYYVNRLSMQPDKGFDSAINDLLVRTTGDMAAPIKARQVIDYLFANAVTLTEVMNNPELLKTLWAYQGESALSVFSSGLQLEQYLKAALKAGARNYGYAADKVSADAAMSVAGSAQPAAYSTTNIQEVGVDEADLIETDGNYLYIAPNQAPPVYYTTDALAVKPAASNEVGAPAAIRIMALDRQPAQAREVAAISLEGFENQVDGLYLLTQRAGSQPDLLVTIGGARNNPWAIWNCPWCWQNARTEVGLFDVSVPEAPKPAGRLSLDGQLIASRRIGESLYLVTRYTPILPMYNNYPATEPERQKNQALLDQARLADLLPAIRVNGAIAALVTAETTYLPPLNPDRWEEPSLLTVTAIDLRDPAKRFSKTIVGPAETVYVSPGSLYVATTRYQYQILAGAQMVLGKASPETTEIHKFGLTTGEPMYRGSATVIGNLGWEADKRPFRLGEDQEVLRVATSLGESWNETSTTRLTLLKETGDGLLAETAHVDNIGEPGERLYAVRYTGSRAYLVTFRVTDPLYVFDLSDPYVPIKAGELHIQGYSDYLQPLSDTRLLGIGKDAVADTASTDFAGRGAWYQGVKLSLFDVANLASPAELSSLIIGKRGTDSDALMDHHAVTVLPAAAGRPARLALPIRKHDTLPAYVGSNPVIPSTHYDWTHTGLYLFNITDHSIGPAGTLIIADRSGGEVFTYGGYGRDRSVIVDDSVHYVHDGKVWSATWGAAETMTEGQ